MHQIGPENLEFRLIFNIKYGGLMLMTISDFGSTNLYSKVHHNQAFIQTLAAGFTDERICLDGIDFVNDQIELMNSNADGVS